MASDYTWGRTCISVAIVATWVLAVISALLTIVMAFDIRQYGFGLLQGGFIILGAMVVNGVLLGVRALFDLVEIGQQQLEVTKRMQQPVVDSKEGLKPVRPIAIEVAIDAMRSGN